MNMQTGVAASWFTSDSTACVVTTTDPGTPAIGTNVITYQCNYTSSVDVPSTISFRAKKGALCCAVA